MKSLVAALNNLSIVVELAIVVFGVLIAVNKKKNYGWLAAVGFLIYVLYNLVALYSTIRISDVYFALALIAGSTLVLAAFWKIYKEK